MERKVSFMPQSESRSGIRQSTSERKPHVGSPIYKSFTTCSGRTELGDVIIVSPKSSGWYTAQSHTCLMFSLFNIELRRFFLGSDLLFCNVDCGPVSCRITSFLPPKRRKYFYNRVLSKKKISTSFCQKRSTHRTFLFRILNYNLITGF